MTAIYQMSMSLLPVRMQKHCLLASLFLCMLVAGCSSVSFVSSEDKSEHYQETLRRKETLRRLKDKILVIDILNLYNKLSLVKRELEGADDKLIFSKGRGFKRRLNLRKGSLLKCSAYHQTTELDLALDCAYLANKISQSNNSEQNLSKIKNLVLSKARKILASDESTAVVQSRQRRSINALTRLMSMTPGDREVRGLLTKLRSVQKKQIDNLMARGDALYREEKVNEALIMWKKAARLDANNKAISDRIDRATKVLEKVKKLKVRKH